MPSVAATKTKITITGKGDRLKFRAAIEGALDVPRPKARGRAPARGRGPGQFFDPQKIGVDPERFQFKSDVDPVTGLTKADPLAGITTWDPIKADRVLVWVDKAGKPWVVDGHHRVALARRLGVTQIEAFVLREKDGINAARARTLAALETSALVANPVGGSIGGFFRQRRVAKAQAALAKAEAEAEAAGSAQIDAEIESFRAETVIDELLADREQEVYQEAKARVIAAGYTGDLVRAALDAMTEIEVDVDPMLIRARDAAQKKLDRAELRTERAEAEVERAIDALALAEEAAEENPARPHRVGDQVRIEINRMPAVAASYRERFGINPPASTIATIVAKAGRGAQTRLRLAFPELPRAPAMFGDDIVAEYWLNQAAFEAISESPDQRAEREQARAFRKEVEGMGQQSLFNPHEDSAQLRQVGDQVRIEIGRMPSYSAVYRERFGVSPPASTVATIVERKGRAADADLRLEFPELPPAAYWLPQYIVDFMAEAPGQSAEREKLRMFLDEVHGAVQQAQSTLENPAGLHVARLRFPKSAWKKGPAKTWALQHGIKKPRIEDRGDYWQIATVEGGGAGVDLDSVFETTIQAEPEVRGLLVRIEGAAPNVGLASILWANPSQEQQMEKFRAEIAARLAQVQFRRGQKIKFTTPLRWGQFVEARDPTGMLRLPERIEATITGFRTVRRGAFKTRFVLFSVPGLEVPGGLSMEYGELARVMGLLRPPLGNPAEGNPAGWHVISIRAARDAWPDFGEAESAAHAMFTDWQGRMTARFEMRQEDGDWIFRPLPTVAIYSTKPGDVVSLVAVPRPDSDSRTMTITVAREARDTARNPGDLDAAALMFERFHGFKPRRVFTRNAPAQLPARVTVLGECFSVLYDSDKWHKRHTLYYHDVEGSRPVLARPVAQGDKPGRIITVPAAQRVPPSSQAVLGELVGVQLTPKARRFLDLRRSVGKKVLLTTDPTGRWLWTDHPAVYILGGDLTVTKRGIEG